MAKSKEEMDKIMDDLKEQLEDMNRSAEQKLDIAEKRFEQLKVESEAYKKIMGGWSKNQIEDMEFEVNLQDKKTKLLESEIQFREQLKILSEQARDGTEEGAAQAEKFLEYSKMSKKQWILMKASIAGSNKELQELIDKMKELDDDIEDGEKTLKKMVKETEKADNLFDSWGKKSVLFSVNIGRVSRDIKEMRKIKNLQKYFKGFAEQFNPLNMIPSLGLLIIETTIKMALAVDTAAASFNAATGAAGRFNDHIAEGRAELNHFGVTAEEVANATKSLLLSTSNYTSLNEKLQKQLTNTSALLSKVSVSTETSAEVFNKLTEAIHVSNEEAGAMMTNLLMMGTDIGISAEKMGKDWLSAMGTLSVYGPRSEEIFTNLAAAAKAAGVSTDDLLKVAGKFDTFQDSARTVAGLNALLGTNLSTTQMLMMTEDERVEHLIKTMQTQGRAFKDLDRWQKKAVANQLGFKDVAEAEMVLSMNVDQYEQYQQQMKEAADAQKKLEEAAVKSMPIATKLLHLFNEAAENLFPLFEWMGEKITWISEAWRGLSESTKTAIRAFFLIGGAITMVLAALAPMLMTIAGIGSLIAAGPIAAGAAIAALVALPLGGLAGYNMLGGGGEFDLAKDATDASAVSPASSLATNSTNRVNGSRTALLENKAAMQGQYGDVVANLQYPEKVVVEVDGTPLLGKWKQTAADVATGRPGRTYGAGQGILG